jgi:methionine-gamma-lyase
MTHRSQPEARTQALANTDNLVRSSICVVDPDDLIADFDQALAAV